MTLHARIRTVLILAGLGLLTSRLALADDPGLLGKRYVGGDFTYAQFHSSRYDHTWGGAADLNLPIAPGYDFSFAYAPTHLTGPNLSQVDNTFSATALAYNPDDYGKTYLSATLGRAWDTTRLWGVSANNNTTYWALGTGLEAALNATTAINYGISYRRSFHGGTLNPTWRFGIGANHWFAPQWAGVVSVNYDMIRHAPDALVYTAGVRYRF